MTANSPSSNVFKKPAVIGWSVFFILITAVSILSYHRYLLFQEARNGVLTNEALNTRDKFKSALDHSTSAIRTLGFIMNRYSVKTDFDTVAKKLLDTYQYVDALELVEGGIITQVYPYNENAAAVGYDILKDSLVNKEAQRAIGSKTIFYAGPILLKQGYVGIVGRLPLFSEGRFWGFSAAIVKLSTLIEAAELESKRNKDYLFQLSKVDPNTGKEQFFLKDKGPWVESDWVSVDVAEGDWKIYARFVDRRTKVALLPFMILGFLFSLSGALFAWYGARQPYRLRRLVNERTRQLKASEERYFSFFEKASDTIIVTNPAGFITEVNTSLCNLLGYTRDELIGRSFSELVEPAQLAIDPVDMNIPQHGKELVRERRLVRKNGDIVELEISVKKIDGDHNLAIGRDLTGLREAQKQVAISESTLRGAFENSAIGMALVAPDGKWLKVNKALSNMLGYSPDEMMAMAFNDITYPDDKEEGIQFMRDATHTPANLYRAEKRYITRGGGHIWVNVNVSSVRDERGQLLYFVTQTEDITEKKKITELLQVREQQLRLFIEYSPAALAMFDKDMRYLITSKRWLSDFGLEGKQVIGKIHYELFPDNPQRWRDIHEQCLQGKIAKSDEDCYVDENGKTIWLRWEVHPWRHFNGEIGGIILFTEIITKLKEAEIKFRNLVEQSLVGVCIVQDGKFSYVNPRFAEIYGYAPQEMINSFPAKSIMADEYDRLFNYTDAHSAEEEANTIHEEAIGKRKDGELLFLEIYGTMSTYDGKPALMCTLLDITERKKAAERILESEEKRRMIMDAALDAIVSIDERGMVIAWNPRAAGLFGWSEQEALGQMLTDTIIPVKYREMHRRGIEHYLATGEGPILHRQIELSAINRRGDEFPIELTIIPVVRRNETSFTAFIRDISERIRAQAQLKESEEKFRNLVEKSLAGVYIIQDGKVRYINPAHQKIMGYSLQELQQIDSVEEFVHEADVPVFRSYHQPGIDPTLHHNQYGLRAIRKDGALVYLEITTSEIIYEGKPALIGTMLDITERVEEEKRISRAVNEAQENERMQIGMELHDNVKQILAAALLTIDFVQAHLSDAKLARQSLGNLKNYTAEAIDELRRLSHQLAPALNKTGSFREQVKNLVRTMKADSLFVVDIDVPDEAVGLPMEVRTAFYRIVQEQMNNIVKYANARSVSIHLKVDPGKVVLTIRDDGNGFDPSLRNNGIGLENLRRRAFVLGGTANIISRPGGGCQVRVTIPSS
jgi:PAS domain S-box-containing protein